MGDNSLLFSVTKFMYKLYYSSDVKQVIKGILPSQNTDNGQDKGW